MMTAADFLESALADMIFYPTGRWDVPALLPDEHLYERHNRVNLWAHLDTETRTLSASIYVVKSAYVPSSPFTLIQTHPDAHYSFQMPLEQHVEFFRVLDSEHEGVAAFFTEDNDPESDMDIFKQYVALVVADRLTVHKLSFEGEGSDCESCGWSNDSLEITHVIFDGKPLYCEVEGTWGCMGGVHNKQTGEAAQTMWDGINRINDTTEPDTDPFWEIARYVQDTYDF